MTEKKPFILGPETVIFGKTSAPLIDAVIKIIASHNEAMGDIKRDYDVSIKDAAERAEKRYAQLCAETEKKIRGDA